MLDRIVRDGTSARQATADAVEQLFARFPVAFRKVERRRVAELAARWLALDAGRRPFDIVDVESECQITIAGRVLNLRIDRLEARPGGCTVVDYKTGNVSVSGLVDERLTEPQLALYALAIDGVEAVAYAQISDAGVRLLGRGSNAVADAAGVTEDPNWASSLRRWRAALDSLMAEVDAGHAAVTPFTRDACDRCHLKPVCRISSR